MIREARISIDVTFPHPVSKAYAEDMATLIADVLNNHNPRTGISFEASPEPVETMA
jgi:hypothetical protein